MFATSRNVGVRRVLPSRMDPNGAGRSLRRSFASDKIGGNEKVSVEPSIFNNRQNRNLSERLRAAKDHAQTWASDQRTSAVNQWKERASSSIEAVKQKTQQWATKTTEPTTNRQERAKQILDQTRKQLGSSWENLSSSARSQIPRAAESAHRGVVGSAKELIQKLKPQLQHSSSTTTESQQQKWLSSDKMRQSISSTGLSAAASRTGQAASNLVKQKVGDASYQALRWFWWWSLAAVFVYGVATTLPVEVLRQIVSSGSGNRRLRGDADNDDGTKRSNEYRKDEPKPQGSFFSFFGTS